MNLRNVLVLLLLALGLAACAKPVPSDKAEYVGERQGKSRVLLIAQDGSDRKMVVDGVQLTRTSRGPGRSEA